MEPQAQAAEDLRAIRRMMEDARGRMTGPSWAPLVIWGVGGVIASLVCQPFLTHGQPNAIALVWNVYWVVCFALHWLYMRSQPRPTGPPGYLERVLRATWSSYFIGILVMVVMCNASGTPTSTMVAFLAILTGLACFQTARLVAAPALIYAAVVWWAGSVAIAAWPASAFLIYAALLVAAYLVPAFFIRRQELTRRMPLAETVADGAAV